MLRGTAGLYWKLVQCVMCHILSLLYRSDAEERRGEALSTGMYLLALGPASLGHMKVATRYMAMYTVNVVFKVQA